MFWIFSLIIGLAFVFIKLGTYSVWVTILSGGLKLALLAIGCLAIALIWHRVFEKKAG